MTLCLDLPMPPSANHSWRAPTNGGVHKSKRYRTWIKEAGLEILAQKNGQEPIKGHFQSHIILSGKARRGNHDLDNRIKGLLDLLETHKLIENDSLNDRMVVEWGDAPLGCKVFVWPSNGESFHD